MTDPVQFTPVRATPVRATPVRATPVRATPVRATPVHTDAVHADALRILQGYATDEPGQRRLRTAYLRHLADHPDATRRDGPPAHLTVGVLVLDPTGERVLLTHHRKAHAWYQFGGHIEPSDATLRDAAARELREESGLAGLPLSADPVNLDRHRLPGGFGRCREHLDVRYAAVAPTDAVPVVSAESHDVRWFALDALPAGCAQDLGDLIAAARRALGLPPAEPGQPASEPRRPASEPRRPVSEHRRPVSEPRRPVSKARR